MKRFWRCFCSAVSILGYIVGAVGLGLIFKDQKYVMIGIIVAVIVAAIIAAFIMTWLSSRKENQYIYSMPDDNIVGVQLKKAIEAWFDNEKYGEVVSFGRAIGRALYISACYETRLAIGEIVEKAAVILGDDNLRVSVLLDDIGWTKVLFHRNDGKTDITTALELAKENGNQKAICKAYRHLAAIEISEWKNPDQAKAYLDEAWEACKKIPTGSEKTSVESGLFYAESEYYLKKGDYKEALNKSSLSETKRREANEIDRYMRCYSQAGKIELLNPNGDPSKARNSFLKGLEESRNVGRIDELVKNAYGYALCCMKTGRRKRAKDVCKKIIKQYGNIPLYSEDDILRQKYCAEIEAVKTKA